MGKEQVLYTSEITEIGEKIPELLEGKMFIPFADFVPDEMKPICVCHTHIKPPHYRFKEGDILCVGEQRMPIVQVGSEVQMTMRELGHCTVRYYDSKTEEKPENLLPGVMLCDYAGDVTFNVGDKLEVIRMK